MSKPIDPTKIERIQDAVISLTIEYGYKSVNISNISKLAGISQGYLYRHYKSKEELLNATFNKYVLKVIDGIEKECKNCNNLNEIIISCCRHIYHIEQEDPKYIQTFIKLYFDPAKNEGRKKCKETIVNMLSGIIRSYNINSYNFSIHTIVDIIITSILGDANLRLSYQADYNESFSFDPEIRFKKIAKACMTLIE